MAECDVCRDLSERVALCEMQAEHFTDALDAIKANTDELVAFARQQIRIEERQAFQSQAIERAFKTISNVSEQTNKRLNAIEKEMPTTILARGWVFLAVVGIIAMVGAYVGTRL